MEEIVYLKKALDLAYSEERRAYVRMRSGFMTFRMYTHFQDRVSLLRKKLDQYK